MDHSASDTGSLFWERFSQRTLDMLASTIAVIDAAGIIRGVSQSSCKPPDRA